MGKPAVWFVDDLSSNRERFRESHKDAFIVTTFRDPAEVLDELAQSGPPNALLCDIYFYQTEEEAKIIEERIGSAAKQLRGLAAEIGADNKDAQRGIALIEEVAKNYKGNPPFPIYAYSCKGPYILDESGFDRIVQSGARWLFKGRNTLEAERRVIIQDIDAFKTKRWQEWVHTKLWVIVIVSAIVGALVGKFL
ncbi:MAG: hypothetical protein L0Z68_09925 [Gammaproteobacteria bacterium]|nr:hypothetical protein [Gammaproteobacteria bacterium]